MTKQQIQILEHAEACFDDIKKTAKEVMKLIKANAETMDAAFSPEQTVYEHIAEQFSTIHQNASPLAADLCADLLSLAIQYRKDAD